MNCTARLGVFLVRQCGAFATGLCGKCGQPTCDNHLTAAIDGSPQRLCPACAKLAELPGAQPVVDPNDPNASTTPASMRVTSGGISPFSDSDIKMFDDVSEFDRDQGKDGVYDS